MWPPDRPNPGSLAKYSCLPRRYKYSYSYSYEPCASTSASTSTHDPRPRIRTSMDTIIQIDLWPFKLSWVGFDQVGFDLVSRQYQWMQCNGMEWNGMECGSPSPTLFSSTNDKIEGLKDWRIEGLKDWRIEGLNVIAASICFVLTMRFEWLSRQEYHAPTPTKPQLQWASISISIHLHLRRSFKWPGANANSGSNGRRNKILSLFGNYKTRPNPTSTQQRASNTNQRQINHHWGSIYYIISRIQSRFEWSSWRRIRSRPGRSPTLSLSDEMKAKQSMNALRRPTFCHCAIRLALSQFVETISIRKIYLGLSRIVTSLFLLAPVQITRKMNF